MKAQFKSLHAAQASNAREQNSQNQPYQASTFVQREDRETELQNEVKNLKQELQIKNNQLASVQNNHKNILDLFNKTSEEVVSLKSQNKELKTVIEKQKTDLLSVSEQKQNIESSSIERIHLLEKMLSEKNGQIQGLQDSLKLITSQNNFVSSGISSLDLNPQAHHQESEVVEQINLNAMQTVESIIVPNHSQNISQMHISQGEPILNVQGQPILGGEQAQLMGDSSRDFSIIDH
jgi:chromosome segregation ATPase